jgi:hypothetical protein
MASKLLFATQASPVVSAKWDQQSELERISELKNVVDRSGGQFSEALEVIGAKKDGQVVVRMLKTCGPAERGTLLLDLEELFKKSVDQGITVWGEALGDKNSLRNLRGIEVKTI